MHIDAIGYMQHAKHDCNVSCEKAVRICLLLFTVQQTVLFKCSNFNSNYIMNLNYINIQRMQI